jgi:anti-sigma B factor antagonist
VGEEERMSVHLDVDQDESCVVTVSGDADLYAAANVERELLRLVDDGRRSIVVDLTDATFIDSTMLRVLLNVSKRLRPGGGELLVVCHEHNIRKIFEITLLDRVFTISETREEALEHLAAAGADPQV